MFNPNPMEPGPEVRKMAADANDAAASARAARATDRDRTGILARLRARWSRRSEPR